MTISRQLRLAATCVLALFALGASTAAAADGVAPTSPSVAPTPTPKPPVTYPPGITCAGAWGIGNVCDPAGKLVGCTPVVVCGWNLPTYWACPPGYTCNPDEIYRADVPGCPAGYRCVTWYPGPYPTYPQYPGYPGYPEYPEYPEYPGECPAGQVGTYPTCQPVIPPIDKPETPKDEPKGDAKPIVDSQPGSAAPTPGASSVPPVVRKPTLAFKGKTKVSKRGQFSVACIVKDAPAGSACRLRVIVGKKVLASVRSKVAGDAARLRLTLTKKQRRKVPKTRKVRVALDLIGPKGDVVLTVARVTVKLPK